MSEIQVIPFDEYSERVKAGAEKCEFITWKVANTNQAFHVAKIDGKTLVPIAFAEKILELSFGST